MKKEFTNDGMENVTRSDLAKATIDKRITFDEAIANNDDWDTLTLYFDGSLELLNEIAPGKYPEAEAMSISVEFDVSNMQKHEAACAFTPIRDGESYDWCDMELPEQEVEALFELAMNDLKEDVDLSANKKLVHWCGHSKNE